MREKTLVLLKPDVMKNETWLDIINIYRRHGLSVIRQKLICFPNRSLMEKIYATHKDQPFFEGLVGYMVSGPVMALHLEGYDAIRKVRNLNGHREPKKADLHSIRGKFGSSERKNAVHSSDSLEAAECELSLVFSDK